MYQNNIKQIRNAKIEEIKTLKYKPPRLDKVLTYKEYLHNHKDQLEDDVKFTTKGLIKLDLN